MNPLPWILAIVCVALLAWGMEERRRRIVSRELFETAKAQRDRAIEQWETLVNQNLERSRIIENSTLRRQGLPIPGEKKEEPKPREHRAVGASQRLAKYLNQPAVVESPRTVGPTDKVI